MAKIGKEMHILPKVLEGNDKKLLGNTEVKIIRKKITKEYGFCPYTNDRIKELWLEYSHSLYTRCLIVNEGLTKHFLIWLAKNKGKKVI